MESLNDSSDFVVAVYFAVGFFFVRLFLDTFVFTRLAIWISGSVSAPAKTDTTQSEKITKCSESMWKLTYYATVEACILSIIYKEPWFTDTKVVSNEILFTTIDWNKFVLISKISVWNIISVYVASYIGSGRYIGPMHYISHVEEHHYFIHVLHAWMYKKLFLFHVVDKMILGYTDHPHPHRFELPLQFVYMCQCGFYTYSIAALLTWETRRKDFSVMMSHHVITVFLIGMSYITRFFRIGSIILALHDGSDVFLEAAKIFKYSEKELAASVFFGFFAFSWLILRLIYFPFWVVSSSSYDLVKHLDLSLSSHTTLYYLFNTMLITLLVFHIYWWVIIYSMIRRQLSNSGKVGEDIRSDSDDD